MAVIICLFLFRRPAKVVFLVSSFKVRRIVPWQKKSSVRTCLPLVGSGRVGIWSEIIVEIAVQRDMAPAIRV
jgi:hypothetical protein